MKVKDVLKEITCKYSETPIEIYNSAHKHHTNFVYKDIAKGNIHQAYLNEEVNSYKQFEGDGAVQIFLKQI
jgi:hypothetical protein